MISLQSDELLETTVGQFMIDADKVAHVQVGNNLEHALLVLTKTGYTAIPVLDASFRLYGLIGTNMIMDKIFGLERIEFEKLDKIHVEEVMLTDIPRLKIDDPILKGFGLVINNAFVCVENEEQVFEGIFTRRVVLKQLNKHLRTLNK
ncbi:MULTISPECIES: cyclic-di-AMP-binding protein CbpB [Bacillus]|uniref:cyclic-di-AMP-binding protein CbpB n=1 Tax=Bacillus TaxID=1386 RepID=UPI0022446071|nr:MULTISPECIES: cyclic-di-AMP-binding protein CbpB [Bacillus]MDN5387207.1 cyclic-di-AMP-binding protein CbpB [Bacillus sp. LB7]MEC1021874.1 c-di-AMP-binding protein CbpB [Bacillus paralicheniformis]MEC1025305.1 c-di-AMP-binding protein CbpB [Bacillus paralicheniformis]MEC1035989.1 c-di-AMP-binding protein CbpB [Bacillus paralicheniformis]MEC1052704.1 c-di-AMP-binding protein CbpB [Bacillus paralicheniformis]